MIHPDKWAAHSVDAWNRRDLEAELLRYSEQFHLRSPFARVYAADGVIKRKPTLRDYWTEVLRRLPALGLELMKVYEGHFALTIHNRGDRNRNCTEMTPFNEDGKVMSETACFDRVR